MKKKENAVHNACQAQYSKAKELNRPINFYLNRVINGEQTHDFSIENECH